MKKCFYLLLFLLASSDSIFCEKCHVYSLWNSFWHLYQSVARVSSFEILFNTEISELLISSQKKINSIMYFFKDLQVDFLFLQRSHDKKNLQILTTLQSFSKESWVFANPTHKWQSLLPLRLGRTLKENCLLKQHVQTN